MLRLIFWTILLANGMFFVSDFVAADLVDSVANALRVARVATRERAVRRAEGQRCGRRHGTRAWCVRSANLRAGSGGQQRGEQDNQQHCVPWQHDAQRSAHNWCGKGDDGTRQNKHTVAWLHSRSALCNALQRSAAPLPHPPNSHTNAVYSAASKSNVIDSDTPFSIGSESRATHQRNNAYQ